jgi:hypothetical protein
MERVHHERLVPKWNVPPAGCRPLTLAITSPLGTRPTNFVAARKRSPPDHVSRAALALVASTPTLLAGVALADGVAGHASPIPLPVTMTARRLTPWPCGVVAA